MNRLLVVGIGSLLMKDDGIGTRVIAALQPKLRALGIFALAGETDVSFCLAQILPGDHLILVDAASRGYEPGDIFVLPLAEASETLGKPAAQHDCSLPCAALLYQLGIGGHFIGIEAAEIGYGCALSEPLGARFDAVCTTVLNAVIQIQSELNSEAGT